MKIAHVSHEYYPTISGVAQVVQELAERQVKAGHEVYIFTSDWDKSKRIKTKEEILNGVHIQRFKHFLRIGSFANVWPQFIRKLSKLNPDIIHSHVFGHVHYVLSSLVSKTKNIPHIHTTHCPWTEAHRSLPAQVGVYLSYNIFSRAALKSTAKVIAITPWEYDFIKKYGGTQEQIINLPNGMDNLFFKKITPNDFKKNHNIKGPLVLFFGRLSITKGPEKFVEIAHEVLKERPNTTFVLRGPDEGMKEEVIKKIGDEKRIILLDPIRVRTEVIKTYQAADVFVLPSFREGLPLTLFEAMASGAPVVASPVNGVPYEIKEPDNGFLVKYGDIQGFKNRIIEFLDNPKLRNKIAQNNIKRSRDYSWDLISDKTLNLYKSVIK